MLKPSDVGKRIKKTRTSKNMTLRDVANRAGVSATLISDIERGKTSPTIKSLSKISKALDTSIVSFIEDRKTREVMLSRSSDRVIVVHDKVNTTTMSLTRKIANGQMEVIEARYGPGASSRKPISHLGEKIIIVVDGRLELTIEDRTYSLESGDTLYFNSELPHQVSNPTNSQTRALWIISPVSRSPVI
jgi:transcriptional regulator with XRE-family HTH domain